MKNSGNNLDDPIEEEISETDDDLCRAMWISVILQAVLDAKSKSNKKCLQKQRQRAREWLGLDGHEDIDDYRLVCELAGIDIDKMNHVVTRVIAEEGAPLDFRCLKKAQMPNRTGELRSRYFRRLEKRRIRRAHALAEEEMRKAAG
jgi:hypothetical protein